MAEFGWECSLEESSELYQYNGYVQHWKTLNEIQFKWKYKITKRSFVREYRGIEWKGKKKKMKQKEDRPWTTLVSE